MDNNNSPFRPNAVAERIVRKRLGRKKKGDPKKKVLRDMRQAFKRHVKSTYTKTHMQKKNIKPTARANK